MAVFSKETDVAGAVSVTLIQAVRDQLSQSAVRSLPTVSLMSLSRRNDDARR